MKGFEDQWDCVDREGRLQSCKGSRGCILISNKKNKITTNNLYLLANRSAAFKKMEARSSKDICSHLGFTAKEAAIA